MVDWLDSLNAAIDLALPLDDRRHPEQRQPRQRPRQRRLTGSQRLIGDQLAIIREHYPHLTQQDEPAAAGPSRQQAIAGLSSEVQAIAEQLADNMSLSRVSSNTSTISADEDDEPTPANPSENDKWCPQHAEVPPVTRHYARRYLGAVLVNSRRKTPWVIHKGRRYYVNWGETRLTPWRKTDPVNGEENEPPTYDSASKESRHEELALARIASATDGWRPAMRERI